MAHLLSVRFISPLLARAPVAQAEARAPKGGGILLAAYYIARPAKRRIKRPIPLGGDT